MKNTTQPSKRALAVLDEPPLTDGTAHKRVSKKVTAAIDKMVSGECRTIADAAEQVGLARESLSRALSRPHVAELMRTKVLRSLAIAATRAGATKVELLDSANEMVRDRASSFVLGLAGIKPSKLPIKRPRAPWKIVAQWRKMAQEGRRIRGNRCETSISRGTTHDGTRAAAPSGADPCRRIMSLTSGNARSAAIAPNRAGLLCHVA